MKQVVIENPVLNSPFEAPRRHFKFDDEGITNEIVEARRISSYFIPIPPGKKRGKQLQFDTEWTQERIRANEWINQVRARVDQWRQGNHVGITSTTRRLLDYWRDPERERKLFFCQIEALETAIYLTEVAGKHGDAWIENDLRKANEDANPLLYRVAFKMATGSGKTVVMAMLIAWQALNKLANPKDPRFSDSFLIVTPGITIRDRLRVLLPNDPQNYYRERDILPTELMQELERAKIIIINFHGFLLRETAQAARLTKQILTQGERTPSPFKETPDQMVRRVCREFGNKKNIVVINDEAHHCYRRRVGGEEGEPLKGQERKEAEKREEEARIWISGLEAVKAKIGVKVVYDLSATPFFLRGSGYSEGTLFPWVVSDFSLIDAIESGIVKVPRVPVADDTMRGAQPTYRDLWLRIRDHLPKKGHGTLPVSGEPKPPKELEGALHSLYGNYEKYYRRWRQDTNARQDGQTPPVFIVVCNNTNVSKLVFDYIGGWEKPLEDGRTVLVPGQLALFSNVEDGHWRTRPNTILIDSEQLENSEAMSEEFKKIAAIEIEEFKSDLRRRFPGRDAEAITDGDLLREVMNTVGKPGKLGEQVKCVVSVSMLTEGWDANTVTHISPGCHQSNAYTDNSRAAQLSSISAAARLPIFFSAASRPRSSSGLSSENTLFICRECFRKAEAIRSLPRGVRATIRTRRSSVLSTRLTNPFATRRSTAMLIEPGVRSTIGPSVLTGKGPLWSRTSSTPKSESPSPVSSIPAAAYLVRARIAFIITSQTWSVP